MNNQTSDMSQLQEEQKTEQSELEKREAIARQKKEEMWERIRELSTTEDGAIDPHLAVRTYLSMNPPVMTQEDYDRRWEALKNLKEPYRSRAERMLNRPEFKRFKDYREKKLAENEKRN